MSSLKGKVAIVTGSSRGIGRAIPFGIASLHAERLGKDGANVVVTYVGNRDKAQEVVSAIEASGSKAIALQVDMRNIAERGFREQVRNRYKFSTVKPPYPCKCEP